MKESQSPALPAVLAPKPEVKEVPNNSPSPKPHSQRDEELETARIAWRNLLTGIHNIVKVRGQKKVFISYAWPTDKAETDKLQYWLVQLKQNLELAGMHVFLDIENMSGKLKETMRREIEESDFVIPILTPRFLERARDPNTNLAFEFRETLKKAEKSPASILPVLREGGFRDVVKDELAVLSEDLIYTIRSDVKTEPFLVGLSDPLGLIPVICDWNHGLSHASKQEYQDLITDWLATNLNHLPQRLSHSVEREALMEKLQNSPRIQIIQGMGGVGKTQLALAYAYQWAENKVFQGGENNAFVHWVNADKTNLSSEWSRLGIALGVSLKGLSETDQKKVIRLALRTKKNWLIVLDNLADQEALKDLLPQNLSSTQQVLITTRSQNWDYPILTVPPFAPSESHVYMESHIQKSGLREGLEELSDALGHLPLALSHAVTYIRETGRGAAEYHRLYKKQGVSLLTESTHNDPNYPFTICSTYQSSVDQLVEKNPEAAEMVKFCAYLHPSNIKGYFLKPLLGGIDRKVYDPYIIEARRVGLLTEAESGSGWTMHPLVQAAVRYNEMDTDAANIFAKRLKPVAETLIELKKQAKDPIKVRELQLHLEAIFTHLQSFIEAKETTESDKQLARTFQDNVRAVMEKNNEEKVEEKSIVGPDLLEVPPVVPNVVKTSPLSATPTQEDLEMAAQRGPEKEGNAQSQANINAPVAMAKSKIDAGGNVHVGPAVNVNMNMGEILGRFQAAQLQAQQAAAASSAQPAVAPAQRIADLTAQKVALEKDREALFAGTFYNEHLPAVADEEQLNKRIDEFLDDQTRAQKKGKDLSEEDLDYLKKCQTAVPRLGELNKQIQDIEKEIRTLKGGQDDIEANMDLKGLNISAKGKLHAGHTFSNKATSGRRVQANVKAEGSKFEAEGDFHLGHTFGAK
ncbi:MAG: putative ATP/GTP-binding protein [Gammaproteobacteria bacterium]|nr:putative ATP/GTP-binding protein [Gammaproteobacteria bacterium]